MLKLTGQKCSELCFVPDWLGSNKILEKFDYGSWAIALLFISQRAAVLILNCGEQVLQSGCLEDRVTERALC